MGMGATKNDQKVVKVKGIKVVKRPIGRPRKDMKASLPGPIKIPGKLMLVRKQDKGTECQVEVLAGKEDDTKKECFLDLVIDEREDRDSVPAAYPEHVHDSRHGGVSYGEEEEEGYTSPQTERPRPSRLTAYGNSQHLAVPSDLISNKDVPGPLSLPDYAMHAFMIQVSEKRKLMQKLEANYQMLERKIQVLRKRPDFDTAEAVAAALDEASVSSGPGGALLVLREPRPSRDADLDPAAPLPTKLQLALNPTQAWHALADVKLETMRLQRALIYSRIQNKYQELQHQRQLAALRRARDDAKKAQRKLESEVYIQQRRADDAEGRLEVCCGESYQRLQQNLAKIFTPSQMRILSLNIKAHWKEEDFRRAVEIRSRVSRRGYWYLRNVMHIPLPGTTILQKGVQRYPELHKAYSELVKANMLKHCTKKKTPEEKKLAIKRLRALGTSTLKPAAVAQIADSVKELVPEAVDDGLIYQPPQKRAKRNKPAKSAPGPPRKPYTQPRPWSSGHRPRTPTSDLGYLNGEEDGCQQEGAADGPVWQADASWGALDVVWDPRRTSIAGHAAPGVAQKANFDQTLTTCSQTQKTHPTAKPITDVSKGNA